MEFENAKEIQRNDIKHCLNRSELVKMKTLLSATVTNIREQMTKRRDDNDTEWLKSALKSINVYREMIGLCDTRMKLIKQQQKDFLRPEDIFIEIAQQNLTSEQYQEIIELATQQFEQEKIIKNSTDKF